jgi:opacity protein-like surface antigen
MKVANKSLLALASVAFAATAYAGPVASPSPAPESAPLSQGGFYFSAQGGALWLDDVGAYGANLDFDTGYSILGTLGYALGNGLAFELESGYMSVESGTATGYGLTGEVDGEFRQVPIIANVVYNIDVTDRLAFYVGAGAGVVWSEAELDSGEAYGLSYRGVKSDSEWNFAAQAKAGLSFKVSQAASVNIGYRYFYGADAFVGVDDAQGSILEGGFTIRF